MNLLDDLELPDDFFHDSLRDMIDNEKQLVYIDPQEIISESVEAGYDPVNVSPIGFMDLVNDKIVFGYKDYQNPRYTIVNDMQPAHEVFGWTEKFFSNVVKPFPVVSIASPIIPPSRYEKYPDFAVVDQVMIAAGYRILDPTLGQLAMYPAHCDNVERVYETYTLSPSKLKRLESMCLAQYVISCEIKTSFRVRFKNQDDNDYVSSHSNGMLASGEMVGDKYLDYCYREVNGLSEFLDKMKKNKKIVVYSKVVYAVVVYVDVHALEEFSKDLALVDILPDKRSRKESRKLGFVKYFSRQFRGEYKASRNLIVGFDFNPYSPYAASDMISVIMEPEGVKYTKRWKEREVRGFFRYDEKRYHSDVWFPELFSQEAKYNKALMSVDLVANSYRGVERDFFKKKLKLSFLTVPLVVDPFLVKVQYLKKLNKSSSVVRAPIHYKVSNVISLKPDAPELMARDVPVFVPYFTSSCKNKTVSEITEDHVLSLELGSNVVSTTVNVVQDNVIQIKSGSTYEDVLPCDFHDYVRKKVGWFNKGIISYEEYQEHVSQCQRYFVLKEFFVDQKQRKRTKGLKEVLTPRFRVWRRLTEGEEAKRVEMFEFVPYVIMRYPCNRWGTLVNNFFTFTLEQFLSQIHVLRKFLRDPPWLYRVEGGENLEIECDEEASTKLGDSYR